MDENAMDVKRGEFTCKEFREAIVVYGARCRVSFVLIQASRREAHSGVAAPRWI